MITILVGWPVLELAVKRIDSLVLIKRAKARPINASRGGQNTRLNNAQEVVLKLYSEKCILAGLNLERKHIEGAANSILRAVGEPLFQSHG